MPQTPTTAELAILQVLWRDGESTVRHVHDCIGEERGVGYTTILKLLQIMHDKGLVTRDASRRPHRFQAQSAEEPVQRRLVGDLVDRVFRGSATGLVLRALADSKPDAAEIQSIRDLLDELDDEA